MRASIDIGNTSAKIGFFEKENADPVSVLERVALEQVGDILDARKVRSLIVSKVKGVDQLLLDSWAKDRFYIGLSSETKLPITIDYDTPHTLGADRIAGVVAAKVMYPNDNCLVIDMGTCITYDFIDENAAFLGGGISPGVQMRFKAMNHFTGQLPLVTPSDSVELVGRSTMDCMKSGVMMGVKLELEGIINEYLQKYLGLRVLLCGGDIFFFESNLKATFFADRHLILRGLNRILDWNESI